MASLTIEPKVIGLSRDHSVAPKVEDRDVWIWVLGAVVAAFVAVAFFVDQAHVRVELLAGAALFGALFIPHFRRLGDAKRGVVRVAREGTLRFMPRGWLGPVDGSAGMFGMVVYVSQHLAQGAPRGQGAVYLYALLVISVYLVGRFLMNLSRPAGMTATKDGLHGVRGAVALNVGWDEIESFDKVPGSARWHFLGLGINLVAAGPLTVRAEHLGSDPAVVAAILTYYLEHPEERHLLADGRAAIARVEEAFASSR